MSLGALTIGDPCSPSFQLPVEHAQVSTAGALPVYNWPTTSACGTLDNSVTGGFDISDPSAHVVLTLDFLSLADSSGTCDSRTIYAILTR